jgi:hypothetical protein
MPNITSATEAALAEESVAIRALLSRAIRDEATTRYDVGVRLMLVKRNPRKYGERAIDRLAEDLGVSSATLYRYSAVAETWGAHDVSALIARKNTRGDPLSWSHFVVLTRAPDASRTRLTEQCLAEAWTVRELTLGVQAEAAALRDVSGDDDAEGPIDAALSEGIESAARATAQLGVFLEALVERLEGEARESKLLSRAITTFRGLRETVDDALESMCEADRRSESRLKAACTPGETKARVRRG